MHFAVAQLPVAFSVLVVAPPTSAALVHAVAPGLESAPGVVVLAVAAGLPAVFALERAAAPWLEPALDAVAPFAAVELVVAAAPVGVAELKLEPAFGAAAQFVAGASGLQSLWQLDHVQLVAAVAVVAAPRSDAPARVAAPVNAVAP